MFGERQLFGGIVSEEYSVNGLSPVAGYSAVESFPAR